MADGPDRSHTERFKQLRILSVDRRQRGRDKVLSRFDLISFSAETESGGKWKSKARLIPDDADDPNTTKFCKLCLKPFGFFSSKKQCTLCGKVMCNECTVRLQLKPPAQGDIESCKQCGGVIKKSHIKANWKQKVEELKQGQLIMWYGTIVALKDSISRSMPNFRGLVYSVTSVLDVDTLANLDASTSLPIPPDTLTELQATASKELDSLKRNFGNLEQRIEKIKSLPETNKSEQTLKNNLKFQLGSFLQSTLPEFRFLSKRFLEIVNNPKVKKALAEWEKKKVLFEEEQRRRAIENRDKEKFFENQSKSLAADTHNRRLDADKAAVRHTTIDGVIGGAAGGDHHHRTEDGGGKQTHRRQSSLTDKLRNFLFDEDEAPSKTSSAMGGPVDIEPVISIVQPAVCPIYGDIDLTIRGANFRQGIKPTRDVKFIGSGELRVKCPAMQVPGPQSLYLVNANSAHVASIEGVLFFSDDPDILASFTLKKAQLAAAGTSPGNPGSLSSSPMKRLIEPHQPHIATPATYHPASSSYMNSAESPPSSSTRGGFSDIDSLSAMMRSVGTNDSSSSYSSSPSKRPPGPSETPTPRAFGGSNLSLPPSFRSPQITNTTISPSALLSSYDEDDMPSVIGHHQVPNVNLTGYNAGPVAGRRFGATPSTSYNNSNNNNGSSTGGGGGNGRSWGGSR